MRGIPLLAPLWKPVGDCGVLAVFGTEVCETVNDRVSALAHQVSAAVMPGVVECVPAFASLLVKYDPLITDYDTVQAALAALCRTPTESLHKCGKTVELPVCYGGVYGPDLTFVATHAGLTPEEVIRLHSGRSYRIYMLGFLPGFPYLGGLDERLFTPRLATPRTKIPAGSVGIGGKQTGVYPLASPGGWQLLGRTPYRLFDPAGGGKLLYNAGDSIRFTPITPGEYQVLAKEAGSADDE